MINENTELFKSYQRILQMATEHCEKCPEWEEQLIREFKEKEKGESEK